MSGWWILGSLDSLGSFSEREPSTHLISSRIIFFVPVICVLMTCCAKHCASKPHSQQKTNEIDARHVRRFYFWWTASRHEKTIARGNGNAGAGVVEVPTLNLR